MSAVALVQATVRPLWAELRKAHRGTCKCLLHGGPQASLVWSELVKSC